jgi:hypothetical protein
MPSWVIIGQCKKLQRSLQRQIDSLQAGQTKVTKERHGIWTDVTDETVAELKAQLEALKTILGEANEEAILRAGDDAPIAPPDWPE